MWVSHAPLFRAPSIRGQFTCTNETPDSTSRRASSTLWPNLFRPYALADRARLAAQLECTAHRRRRQERERLLPPDIVLGKGLARGVDPQPPVELRQSDSRSCIRSSATPTAGARSCT